MENDVAWTAMQCIGVREIPCNYLVTNNAVQVRKHIKQKGFIHKQTHQIPLGTIEGHDSATKRN